MVRMGDSREAAVMEAKAGRCLQWQEWGGRGLLEVSTTYRSLELGKLDTFSFWIVVSVLESIAFKGSLLLHSIVI